MALLVSVKIEHPVFFGFGKKHFFAFVFMKLHTSEPCNVLSGISDSFVEISQNVLIYLFMLNSFVFVQ